jgi:hypothetical protein
LALIVAGALVTPHFLWAREHSAWVLSTSSKLKIAANQPWLTSVLRGLGQLAHSVLSHLGPLALIYAAICWKPVASPGPRTGKYDAVRVIGRALVAMMVILLAGIFLFKVTGFKDRWLMPLCVWLPLALVLWCSARLNPARSAKLSTIAVIIAVVVMVLIPGRVWFAKAFHLQQALNMPFDALNQQLRQMEGTRGLLIAADNWVGGNLKRSFPAQEVVTPNICLAPQTPYDEAILVWNANKSDAMPPRFLVFINGFAEFDTNQIRFLEAPLKFWPDRSGRLAVLPCRLHPDTAEIIGRHNRR